MKFYEFGRFGNPTIMCLPGNFMTHRQFEHVVPLLERDYHVITVSFDGYDETGETVYTTGAEQAEKLAVFIRERLNGKIDLVYAESLGSIPAVYLTRCKGLQIGRIIVSGAEYMNYGVFNQLAIDLFAPMTYRIMKKIIDTRVVKLPKFLLIKMAITNEMLEPMLNQACQMLTLETTKATFWEAVKLYPEMNTWKPNPDVCICCWYGEKEMNMKKAIKCLKRAFPNVEVHPFKNFGHGEIMTQPQIIADELRSYLKDIR